MAHGCRLRIRLSRRQFGVQRTRSNKALTTQVDPERSSSAYLPIYAEVNDTFEKLGK